MKIAKFSILNIVYFIIFFLIYYFILFNIILSIIYSFTSLYVLDIYYMKKRKADKFIYTEFMLNSFIKNFAISSLSNNYNILDSLKKGSKYLDQTIKNDIEICISEIEVAYNYEKAFKNLADKYKHNRVFLEFLTHIMIIKEQSNIESSAKNIYNQSSIDSQKYIVQIDKVAKIKREHFNNYLINTAIGLFVIYLIVFALNVYYIEYAKSIQGLALNSIAIIISLLVTLKLINKTFEVNYE